MTFPNPPWDQAPPSIAQWLEEQARLGPQQRDPMYSSLQRRAATEFSRPSILGPAIQVVPSPLVPPGKMYLFPESNLVFLPTTTATAVKRRRVAALWGYLRRMLRRIR